MIRVHYKPLAALRPVHIALLAAVDRPASCQSIISDLAIPETFLANAIDDLTEWEFATLIDGTISLTVRGVRCVAAWIDTGRCGYWEFEGDTGWVLGKGSFFFRSPLSTLDDAGLNVETGSLLKEEAAMSSFKERQKSNLQLEAEIKQEWIRSELLQAVKEKRDTTAIIERSLLRAKTKLHFNQLSRLAEVTLLEIEREILVNPMESDLPKLAQARATITRLRQESNWRIRDEDSTAQDITRVLLAAWLRRRVGVLKEIAQSDPGSLFLKSECDDLSWTNEKPAQKAYPQTPDNSESTGDFFDGVLRIFRSFFQ